MPTDITPANIFDNISEMFLDDLETKDSSVNKLIDEITLNIIITKLEPEKRIEFYAQLMSKKYDEAKTIVLTEIPNLNYLIFSNISNILNTTL